MLSLARSLRHAWHTFPAPARYVVPAIVVLLLWLVLPHQPARPPTPSQRMRRPDGVTMNDYRALNLHHRADRPRTTYAQAAALMGQGTPLHTSADGRTRTYQWNGGGRWSRLEATFRDGRLVGKSHFVLSYP